jgi:chloramphenicol 3-O phosphotransferase
MIPGNIILLNGTSSSGKTTLAKALQGALEQPYFHVDVDLFQQSFPPGFLVYGDGLTPAAVEGWLAVFRDDTLVEVRMGPAGYRLAAGLYRAIAGWASAGNHLIVDTAITHPRILAEAVQALYWLPVLFVGVRCQLEIAEQREVARGNRARGGARTFYASAHAHGLYDLEVDTSFASPGECAQVIKAAIERDQPRTAFRQLAQALLAGGETNP